MTSQELQYFYGEINDFETIKDFIVAVFDSKVEAVTKKNYIQYLIGLLEFGLLNDDVRAELAKYAKFFIILLYNDEYNLLVARLLCSIISGRLSKWEVDNVRNLQSKTGSSSFIALLRQMQMMRPDLVPEECSLSGSKWFPKLSKKIQEQFEWASENTANKTFQKVTDICVPPPAKMKRMDIIPAIPQYSEVTRRKREGAYLTQVEHFRDFQPLMPTLRLPNVIASCLREVNLHPIVAIKLTDVQISEFNRWVYLTLENELLESRHKKSKKGIEYLLPLLRRFVAGTGVELPGIFVVLAEYLLQWNGNIFRDEVLELLPQIPIKLAEFEEVKCGIYEPLVKVADGGDTVVKRQVVQCIGKLVVNLRYRRYKAQKTAPDMTSACLKNHYKMLGLFGNLCGKILAEVETDYGLLDQMLMEYENISACETRTSVARFCVIPKALRLSILYSPHLDLVASLFELFAEYISKVTPSGDQTVRELVRDVHSELKTLLTPNGPRNLATSLAFFPIIGAYAQSERKTLKVGATEVFENPVLILPTLREKFPEIANVLSMPEVTNV